MTSREVIEVVADLLVVRGTPGYIRSDNGPEFIAVAIRRWLERTEVKTLYIEPGAPWENGYAESFQSRLRDELLNVEEFATVAEAQELGRPLACGVQPSRRIAPWIIRHRPSSQPNAPLGESQCN